MSWRRARIVLLAALALLIPLRAAAGDGSGSLSVSASLGGCGVAGSGVVCRIDTTFNPVAGAEYYTATVTLADASVQSLGNVGPGGTSLYVPYVGAGSYRVEITAWGYDAEGDPEQIDSDQGKTESQVQPPTGAEGLETGSGDDPADQSAEGEETQPGDGDSDSGEPAQDMEQSSPTPPDCESVEQPETDPEPCPEPQLGLESRPEPAAAAEPTPTP